MIPADSPACMARAKKALFTASRLGSPKEMLDTPHDGLDVPGLQLPDHFQVDLGVLPCRC